MSIDDDYLYGAAWLPYPYLLSISFPWLVPSFDITVELVAGFF